MNSFKRNFGYFSKLIWALALLVPVLVMMQTQPATPALAAGTVGSGIAGSCTEAALNTALSGGGAVTFNCGTSPVTITVTSQKVIGVNTTIDGGGLVTLSGGGTTSVFLVNPGILLSLQNLTVANGNGTGGAVNNQGTLNLLNSTLYNNFGSIGGGVFNASTGVVNVTNSTLFSNTAVSGGGVYNVNGGRLNVTNATFISNTASTGFGGGVDFISGTLNITTSTFANNFAFLQGGAVAISGTANINNSTFYNNNTNSIIGSGGAVYNTGALTVTNSTIDSNSAPTGGGIFGNTTLRNTIVSNSLLGGNCSGTITDGGGNLQWAGTVSLSCGGSIGTGNPALGPLANNGGATQTMSVGGGSAAIGHAFTNCPATDQRGAPRGANCDSGAYQHQTTSQTGPSFIVTRTDDTDTGMCAVAFCSLREAINAANTAPTVDTITFSVSGTIILGVTLPSITGTLTINGAGQNIAISGNNAVRVMSVNGSATLALQNLTIENGQISGNGAGVYNTGTLNVTNSTFYNNNGDGDGGGITNAGTLMNVTNSTFYSNSANIGGGIYGLAGTLNVANSTFYNNQAAINGASSGGGVFTFGTMNLTNSTFYNNNSPAGGGVINFGALSVTNSTFYSNTAVHGGNLYNFESTTTLKNTIIANAPSGGNCFVFGGNFSDGGGNLQFGDSSCGGFTTADPKLGPLASNGGTTQTMALLAGSAAINLAAANCPATDQRSFVRRGAPSLCDSGAYQRDGALLLFLPLILR